MGFHVAVWILYHGTVRDWSAVFYQETYYVLLHHFIKDPPDEASIAADSGFRWAQIFRQDTETGFLFTHLERVGFRLFIPEQAMIDALVDDGEDWHYQSPKHKFQMYAFHQDCSFLVEVYMQNQIPPYGANKDRLPYPDNRCQLMFDIDSEGSDGTRNPKRMRITEGETLDILDELDIVRGGGALCHEWAYALDFNLYSLSHGFTNGKQAALSDDSSGMELPYVVRSAFEELMKAIIEGNGKRRVDVPEVLPEVKGRYRSSIYQYLSRNDGDISRALAGIKGNYRIKPKQWDEIGFAFCHRLKEEDRGIPTSFYVPTDNSQYFLDAVSRGAYWYRKHELFARAFESWIEDELAERGMTNSYLVSGTQYGGPYPIGKERETINAAFRIWWTRLLNSGILQDEQLWKGK